MKNKRCLTLPLLTLLLLSTARADTVTNIKVQPDKAPDCSSLKSIIETITRDCKTNDEKAIAIYNFCMLTEYHRAYPTEPGGVPSLKVINCYGWSLCGGLHTVESALWIEAGWEHRYVGWNGHTTVEAKYDGRWHYLDTFLKFYAWMPDGKGGRTIASEDDLTKNSDALIKDVFVLDKGRGCVYAKDNQFVMNGEHANWRAPAFLSCGDTIEGTISGLKTHHVSGPSDGWAGINHSTGSYPTEVDLTPGLALTNTWDAVEGAWYWANEKVAPAHTCPGFKDTRNDPAYGLILEPYINASKARSFGTGMITFSPDFSSDAVLKSFTSTDNAKFADGGLVPVDASKPGTALIKLASPYILTRASGEAAGADLVEVSVDGGKNYKAADLKEFTPAVKGQLAALVRISFKTALKSVHIDMLVQNNPGSLPYLSPGKNVVAVSIGDPKELGDNKLVVTYAYKLGSRTKSFDQLCDQGKEIARQHNAKWSDTVTYVQKTFTAKDLPAKLEIDCPTPKGEYAVYPRMMLVRREIISASAKPLALPEGAVAAKPSAADELQTLPNPFLIGTEAPQAIKTRAVKTTQIPLEYIQYCDEKGAIAETGQIAWPKIDAEKGKVIESAVLIGGELKNLPSKGIAAARLIIPVVQGHNKANAKIGAVFLASAIEKGKACDFKNLDQTAGSVIVPIQPAGAAEYKPAKPFAIDVTHQVKEIASGAAKFNGVAVRILPDRGVDDGYTVRCLISNTDKVVLEVDTFAEDAAAAK